VTQHLAWDLDGVLVDMDAPHRIALNRALQPRGTTISMEEHVAWAKGLPTRVKLAALVKARRIREEDVPGIAAEKQRFTLEAILGACKPDPEKVALLRGLKGAGVRMCVCSNAVRQSVELMVDLAGIFPFVEFVLSNEDVRRPKPHPEIYQVAAARLGVDPLLMTVVEDSPPGQQAALAAGCRLIAVTGPWEVTRALLPAIMEGLPAGRGA
jgi:HAD superfamily hydrolase (TIGR01509 family)